jgi:hypothetical protein
MSLAPLRPTWEKGLGDEGNLGAGFTPTPFKTRLALVISK